MSEDFNDSFSNNNGTLTHKSDLNISDVTLDFNRLRVSALTKAAELSPHVKEITIGPRSPIKKTLECKDNVEANNTPNSKNETVDKIPSPSDLKYTATMKLYASAIKENTEAVFEDLIYKMVAKRAEYMKKYWTKQSEACERGALELKARKQQMLKEIQNNDVSSVLESVKEDEHNSQYIHMKTMENMKRILEEQNNAASRFASLTNSHTRICISYNEIYHILENDEYAKKVSNKYLTSINNTVNNINKLMDYSKNGNVTDAEVTQGEVFALNMENIKTQILQESAKLKQEDQQIKKQKEEEAKQKEILKKEVEQKEIEQKVQVAKQQEPSSTITQIENRFYSQRNFAYYEELKKFLSTYENSYKSLTDDASTKKFRFDCQKAVNIPVNAIASVSGAHLKDKYDKLSKLLRGERVQVLDIYVQANQHPLGLQFCTALLAKKIVLQGSSLISSQPEAAFPLAAVAVALWSQFPDFGRLLEANFHRQCPYLVPMFLPQTKDMSEKDFYLMRGYVYSDDGVVEKQDKFLKRMSGIFTLYCAICTAQTPKFLNTSNPHGLMYGWRWLASFINLKPEPDISATLLFDFFTFCGHDFLKYYGNQFKKIIKLIASKYFAILNKIDEGGPKTRLEVLLQNIITSGQIPPPNGLLKNIW